MGLFGLVFLAVALLLIGVGFAVGLVICAITAGLVALGIVSSSMLVGVRAGRSAAALRAFLFQCCVVAGAPIGAFCAWIAQSWFEAFGRGWPVLVYGTLGGAVAGGAIAQFSLAGTCHVGFHAVDVPGVRLRILRANGLAQLSRCSFAPLRFCTAWRSRNSIWPLMLRRSAAAHFSSSRQSSGGMRKRKGFLSPAAIRLRCRACRC